MLLTVEIEVEHLSGKFASKDAVFEAIAELIDAGDLDVDEATYEVASANLVENAKLNAKKGRG